MNKEIRSKIRSLSPGGPRFEPNPDEFGTIDLGTLVDSRLSEFADPKTDKIEFAVNSFVSLVVEEGAFSGLTPDRLVQTAKQHREITARGTIAALKVLLHHANPPEEPVDLVSHYESLVHAVSELVKKAHFAQLHDRFRGLSALTSARFLRS